MHYGEVKERTIRGKTNPEKAHALIEEGISVVPLPPSQAAKETLQQSRSEGKGTPAKGGA